MKFLKALIAAPHPMTLKHRWQRKAVIVLAFFQEVVRSTHRAFKASVYWWGQF